MAQETAIFRTRDGEREEVRRVATLPRRSFVLLKARDGLEWQSGGLRVEMDLRIGNRVQGEEDLL